MIITNRTNNAVSRNGVMIPAGETREAPGGSQHIYIDPPEQVVEEFEVENDPDDSPEIGIDELLAAKVADLDEMLIGISDELLAEFFEKETRSTAIDKIKAEIAVRADEEQN